MVRLSTNVLRRLESAFSVGHDSEVVGGQIGIQHQFGNIVLGVEGTLTTAFRDSHASTDCPNTLLTCAARFDDVLTVGPRIGWAMGKWMPYITGGYAERLVLGEDLLFKQFRQCLSGP